MAQHQEVRLQQVVEPRLFEIADYQRAYAWEAKQLKDLWADLDLMGPKGSHYAGTLVIREILTDGRPKESMSDDGTTLTSCEVVDGQQRLTTCFLLIDRVRRRLEKLGARGLEAARMIADRARATYGLLTVDGADVPRLRLGSDLNDFWVDTVLMGRPYVGRTMEPGQARLREAARYYDDMLATLVEGVPDEAAFRRLKDLYGRITSGLKFLVYEVGSAAEVGVIFETLNERGRPLTNLEKAKNYFLYLARTIPDAGGEQVAQEVNAAWGDIFVNLAGEPRSTEDQLLRAHWLATVDPDARSWQGIDSIKRHFDRSRFAPGAARLVPQADHEQAPDEAWQRLRADVGGFVRSLRDCSFFNAEMRDPGARFESFDAGVRERIRIRSAALRRSGAVAPYRPLLFAARLARPGDGAFYADLVDLCEKFSARIFVIEHLRSNTGQSKLYRLANTLHTQRDAEYVKREMQAMVWYYASDEQIRKTFDQPQAWYWRPGHKYFLYEYERSQITAGSELPAFESFTEATGPQRTTEHILPQSAAAPCWSEVFSTEQHARHVHTLGNLVLTLDNSRYSNKCFAAKRGAPLAPGEQPRPCYAQAQFRQERELAMLTDWTPATIMERQRRLGEWAIARWHIDPPTPEELDQEAAESAYEADDEAAGDAADQS